MEFTKLIEAFAERHGIADLSPEEESLFLDIDGIEVSIVALGDELAVAAEIGEPPVDGRAEFADAMLESNVESAAVFVKSAQTGKYMLMRRLSLPTLDGESFDAAVESIVNMAEAWRKMLDDFRPAAKAAAEKSEAERVSFGASEFMQV